MNEIKKAYSKLQMSLPNVSGVELDKLTKFNILRLTIAYLDTLQQGLAKRPKVLQLIDLQNKWLIDHFHLIRSETSGKTESVCNISKKNKPPLNVSMAAPTETTSHLPKISYVNERFPTQATACIKSFRKFEVKTPSPTLNKLVFSDKILHIQNSTHSFLC